MESHAEVNSLPCPNCGRTVAADQRFCGHCGHALRITCPNCSTENPLNHRFCNNCGHNLTTAITLIPAADARDERRWVTVMFADISGYTAMTEKMDPEDVMTLSARVAGEIGTQVQRFGGTALRTLGDEVLAVFGAPVGHEDDAERAVRAALAICDLDLSESADQQIRVHIGVNTGEVMAGIIGLEGRQDYDVMGDVVNTAARLRSAAPPGSVWVGRETYQASLNAVRFAPLPPLEAHGKAEPIEAWEALEMVAQPHARPFGTTSFIGRDQELRRLLTMWRWAADSQQPHLVTVLGEAGMGKSRLVAEFEERLPETAVVLHGTCLPYGAARSYGALEMMLKEAAGISVNDDAESARARLDQLVRSALEPDSVEGDPDELAQHLALMSGLDVEADRRTGSRDGRVFRVSARRFLTGLARRAPLCLVFDNIHWADAELLDLIEHVAAKVHSAPLLLATLARPELLENRPTWGRGVQSFTSLALQALDANTERQLILSLCREHGLPEEFAEEIARDVGGNPLYAEELVAMVAEQGREGGIPVAIKLLISARLDTLPPSERRLLQVASVFGTVFWKGGLRHLIGRDVSQELEALEQKGLLRVQARSSHPGELEFLFKHDLISEVAYEILPRAERRDLHGLVVDWLEETAGEQIEKFLDLIAHHAVEGALPEKAVTYLIRAAERAGRATAHRQKVALLDEAFAIALSLDAHDMLADIHGRRGRAFIDYGQWVSAEEALSTALALLPEDAFAERVQILCDLSWTRFWLADVAGQHEASREALALAEKLDRDDLVAKALFADGQSRTNEAKFDETLKSLHGAIERAGDAPIMEVSMAAGVSGLVYYWHGKPVEAIKYSRLAVLKGQSQQHTLPTAFAMPHLGLALAAAGRYYEAEDAFREALQFGQEYELGPFLSRAMAMSAGYHLDVFDYAGNEEIATEAREMGLSQGTPQSTWSASIDLLLNFARSHKLGAYERLFPEVVEFVEKAHGFHRWLWRMRIAEARAEVALAQGDWEEAFQWAELGITRSREFGRPKYEALGLHSRASARLVGGHKRQAIEDLRRALALARSTDDPALQLRIGTSLLEIDGDDELLTELKATATGIAATLPTERVRRAFEAAEPVKLLNRS